MMWWLVACREEPVKLPRDTGEPPDPVDDTLPTVISSTPCAACGGDCLIEELAYAARYHATEPVDYTDRPPAGGPHDGCWATWGVHPDPVPDDNFVHNLEHGGVVWLYSCDTGGSSPSGPDCAADALALAELAVSYGDFTLVTPYPDMDARFATVAWGWRLTAGCVDLDLQATFFEDHVDQAPESLTAEPSAACR
jgi:hypothetical protein